MNYINRLNAFYSCVKTDQRLTSAHVSLYMALFQYWNYNRFHQAFAVHRERLMDLCKIGSKNTYHKCLKELHAAGYIRCHRPQRKFDALRISMSDLGARTNVDSTQQLEIFASVDDPQFPPTESHYNNRRLIRDAATGENGKQSSLIADPGATNVVGSEIKYDTLTDSNLVSTGHDIDTTTDAIVGHPIKENIYKKVNSVCVHTQIFEKDKKISEEINSFKSGGATVSNTPILKHRRDYVRKIPFPSIEDVEAFFKTQNYALAEAQKFFHYNNGKGWRLSSRAGIMNWKSFGHKWMLNVERLPTKRNGSIYHTNERKDYTEAL